MVALRVNASYNKITDLANSPAASGIGRNGGIEQGTLCLFCVVRPRG